MAKQKSPFEIRKIRRRKKSLPASRIRRIKALLHGYDLHLKYVALAVITVLMTGLVYMTQQDRGWLFKASILQAPRPFDGTVFPVDKVPDWTHWEGDNHTTLYSQVSSSLLASLPSYDLQTMQFPTSSLEWGNPKHDEIRNTKITYSVVYLGNYQLDHTEGVGSHLAVDIRMPRGTPIKNIANGKVVKVSMQSGGFGHHVVVQHPNVPDPDDPSKKTTLYSAFNHMDEIYVSEGQLLSKGHVLGTSGNTGTSTTPHLHFQIDRDSAPWHPYWPFTWEEAQAAGLSFFEAVNAGLGLNNAKEHTINPMPYVAKYLNYSGSSVDSGTDTGSDTGDGVSDSNPDTNNQEDTQDGSADTEPEVTVLDSSNDFGNQVEETPEVEVLEEPEEEKIDTTLFAFKITAEDVSMVKNGVTVTATDMLNQVSKMSDTDVVRVEVSGVGYASKSSFRKSDFNNGSVKFVINSAEPGIASVVFGKSAVNIEFVEAVKPIASLKIETDGYYQKNVVEVIKLVALDDNGDPTPVVNFAGVINISAKEGQASFTPSSLDVRAFINGVAEVRMTVNNEERVVVRAQNGAIIGESDYIYSQPVQLFTDVPRSHKNYEAIKFLVESGVISGYPDGTYKPDQTVNRVEALKMLMLAFGVDAGPAGPLPFQDTQDGAWYAGTLATAVGKGIVKGYPDGTFKPAQTVNKAEYLKMLYLTNGIEPNPDLTASPYPDVPKDSWYAPYAYMMNRQNLLEVPDNRLSAANGMTRGDVAETVFRMRYLLDNNLFTYSR